MHIEHCTLYIVTDYWELQINNVGRPLKSIVSNLYHQWSIEGACLIAVILALVIEMKTQQENMQVMVGS